jgi:uncharacterized protein YjbJ (UPF0337 family)
MKGQAENHWDTFTDDELDQIAGQREQLIGKLRQKYGVAKDEVELGLSSSNLSGQMTKCEFAHRAEFTILYRVLGAGLPSQSILAPPHFPAKRQRGRAEHRATWRRTRPNDKASNGNQAADAIDFSHSKAFCRVMIITIAAPTAQGAKPAYTSSPLAVPAARHVARSTSSTVNFTEPSHIATLTPPG